MQPALGNSQPRKNHESRIIRCPNCGHHNPPGQKFCGACGSPLQSQTAPRQNVSPPAAPVAKRRKQSKWMTPTIIGAIITGIVAIIVAAINILPAIWGGGSADAEVSLKVRVADIASVAPLQGAKVVLFPAGYVQYTDGDGVASFTISKTDTKDARLFVENAQYDISDKNISLARAANDLEIRLKRKDSNDHKVIVRVVDTSTNAPIINAKVVFIVGGNTSQDFTDSNGLATFTITFQSETIDADITVQTGDYTIEHQQLTLRPETVQDMNLDRNANTLEVKDFKASVPAPVQPDSSGSNTISFGQTVSGNISASGISNKYVFTANANTAVSIRITKTSGDFCAEFKLFGPDGKPIDIGHGSCDTEELNVVLSADGTYTIIVYDYNGAGTGAYALSLQKTN